MDLLEKELMTGRFTAALDEQGQLTITEIGLRTNLATGELEPANTIVILPPQAVRSLANLLRKSEARALIHYRKVR